ncbi:MAG: PrpF domain-containing protein [Chloroflexota bacterium]
MPQITVPASFYRGGTSRAVLFREADLAAYDDAAQRAIILAAVGSPDQYGREIDGLGGGISSLSKVCIVGVAGPDTGADVTFRFGQVDVEHPLVEFMGTCGNMSSAIGPFAVDEGLVEAVEPVTTVRVLSVNTGQIYVCHVPVKDGRAETEGDYSIDGVPGPAARIALEFLEPGGSLGKGLLPTGKVRETIALADGRSFEVSLVDAANPLVFVRAADLGSDATERPDEVDANKPLHATLEEIRDHAAVLLGFAPDAATAHEKAKAQPKVMMVAPPKGYRTTGGVDLPADRIDLTVRMISMSKCHRTLAGTAGICTSVAAAVEGTVVHEVARAGSGTSGEVRIGHGAGVIDIGVKAEQRPEGWHAISVSTFRTARRIMDGRIYVPSKYLEGTAWFQLPAREPAAAR